MEFLRIFHPVGQGAFYSERHISGGNEITVVYDCGSTTLWRSNNGTALKTKINSAFLKNHTINILFLSHFDSDHINGVDYLMNHCNIEKVVIPLLDDDTKVLIKTSNKLFDNFSNTQLIDSPDEYFGDSITVIKIRDIEPADGASDPVSFESPTNISGIGINDREKDSGTVFNLGTIPHWFYIPFNYRYQERKNIFMTKLRENHLNINNINTPAGILEHQAVLKTIYKGIKGGININSMALFSGMNAYYRLFMGRENSNPWQMNCHFRISDSGCLYLGDMDLNQPLLINDVKSRLQPLIEHIGTVQIPHHGAICNFNRDILRLPALKYAVISFGKKNHYGHPSDSVVSEIITSRIVPLIVNERQHTLTLQWH
jgi:beta-lactamase superfamily II metal-dependent hydrolase